MRHPCRLVAPTIMLCWTGLAFPLLPWAWQSKSLSSLSSLSPAAISAHVMTLELSISAARHGDHGDHGDPKAEW